MIDINEISNKFWNIADLLRDTVDTQEVMDIILSLLMLKKFDSELLKQNNRICDAWDEYTRNNMSPNAKETLICANFNVKYFNHSKIRFNNLMSDSGKIIKNTNLYINSFSSNIKEIFDEQHLNLLHFINKLDPKMLEGLIDKIININIDGADTQDIGDIFEELLRRFSEDTAKKAGAFYTPRDIVKLLVKILVSNLKDEEMKTVYDCACGTGGILNGCYKELKDKVDAVELYGQEKNSKTWAIAKGEMEMQEIEGEIANGNTLTDDKITGKLFDYIGANPPFGVKWEQESKQINKNEERYNKGLPSIDDGQLLFDMTCLFKLNNVGRAVIIHNLSPLFKGKVSSGESQIRKFILENDFLECVVLLPNDLFFNTNIPTCMLIYSRKKEEKRKNKLQIINASKIFTKLAKALNKKQVELSNDNVELILKEYIDFKETDISKIIDIDEFKQVDDKGTVGYKIEYNKYFPIDEEEFEPPEVIFERILQKKAELDESFKELLSI
ncbi:MAG: type I restriction-modification system subunit M [Rickettsiales bacterium]|jgi:type I restriction enzyme M protein|nr:type I restriction-modification system subunit M [Rickettsiales bacterium]